MERRFYDDARRSLRIWPIKGKENSEIRENVEVFCSEALLLSGNLGIVKVERARSSPRGRAFLEVIVEFEDPFARDRVFACGPQLAGFRDDEGRPTCGLRLQIPQHLMGQFRTLESFAFVHRSRHKGEVRKHIKFDDANACLYIQIKHRKDDDWMTFSYEHAKMEQEKNNTKKTKRSFLFKTPEKAGDMDIDNDNDNLGDGGSDLGAARGLSGGGLSGGGAKSKNYANGSYIPAERDDCFNKDKGGWRPPARREEDVD